MAVQTPTLPTPGPQSFNFTLCEMRLPPKAVMNTQCNKCLGGGRCDQVTVTMLLEMSSPTQRLKERAFRATYVRTFKSYGINWKVLTIEIK